MAKKPATPSPVVEADDRKRLGVLLYAFALPIEDSATLLDIPRSTLDKLIAEGRGPHTFFIGRRLYIRNKDLKEWVDRLAEAAKPKDEQVLR